MTSDYIVRSNLPVHPGSVIPIRFSPFSPMASFAFLAFFVPLVPFVPFANFAVVAPSIILVLGGSAP